MWMIWFLLPYRILLGLFIIFAVAVGLIMYYVILPRTRKPGAEANTLATLGWKKTYSHVGRCNLHLGQQQIMPTGDI